MTTTRRDALKSGLACSLWLTTLACSSSSKAPAAPTQGGASKPTASAASKPAGFMPTEPIQPISAPFPMAQLERPRIPERVFDVERWEAPSYCGHFPALETPDVLADSLVRFVSVSR